MRPIDQSHSWMMIMSFPVFWLASRITILIQNEICFVDWQFLLYLKYWRYLLNNSSSLSIVRRSWISWLASFWKKIFPIMYVKSYSTCWVFTFFVVYFLFWVKSAIPDVDSLFFSPAKWNKPQEGLDRHWTIEIPRSWLRGSFVFY